MSEDNQLKKIDKILEQRPEFSKMLNNLLGIKSRDNSVFTSSKINNFDLSQLVNEEDLIKAFTKDTFNIEITDFKNDNVIQELANCSEIDRFLIIADENDFSISIADRKLLERDFNSKDELILKLKKQRNKKIAKWKKFQNKYKDLQSQINTWPLYIGVMQVKVQTTRTAIYAPLLFKKVVINITKSNRVYIKSIDDSVEINEKLMFLLKNEYKIGFPTIDQDDKHSFEDVVPIFESYLSKIGVQFPEYLDKYEFLRKQDVNNQELKIAPGMIMTLVSPSGGNLRNKMMDIIEQDDMDQILDIDPTKDLKREVTDSMIEGEKVFRITQTDMSQEKAIIGSLRDNSIIWGPPGTGKSQTISNILANILHRGNKTLVTSEKKAALDVIQERMGTLSKYMFFALTDKNVNKEAFYKPFQELAKVIREGTKFSADNSKNIFLYSEKTYWNNKDILANEDIDVIKEIYANIVEHKLSTFEVKVAYQYSTEYRDFISNIDTSKSFEENLESSEIQKRGFIFKKYPKKIRKLGRVLASNEAIYNMLGDVIKVNDIKIINELDAIIKGEINYTKTRYEFSNDSDYLEYTLAKQFRQKVEAMEVELETRKRIRSFLKSSESAWILPYKFVNKFKDIIQELFDVFVSTPNSLAGVVDMDSNFEYAIFDESSQMHLEKAIPFLYLADISIIAGDSQQMRPTSYFGIRDNSEVYEDTEENVASLLDYALRKGLKAREYMLNKNYRSESAELMLFSSDKFYEGELDVVDNASRNEDNPIEVFEVNGKWEGRINEKEAHVMLDKLIECNEDYEKIILLTLNSTQKQYVDSLIYKDEKYNVIIDMISVGKVVLRNLENIQGDEADLVIASVAYDKSARLGATYVAKAEGKNALNVAISRAKRKMIIFKSIKSNEVSKNSSSDSINIFRDWLKYLEQDKQERLHYIEGDSSTENFDSDFEVNVYGEIKNKISTEKKLYIETQFKVGSYSIDIAISDSKTGKFILGIEVDGYKYHSGNEKMIKDIERQRYIESKGYPIFRITELDWKINKDKTLDKIKSLLK